MEDGLSLWDVGSTLLYNLSDVGSSWVTSSGASAPAPTALPAETFPSGIPVYVTDIPSAIRGSELLAPLAGFWEVYVPIALFITLLLAVGIGYCIIRIFQIRKLERMAFETAAHTVRAKDTPKTTLRWQRIMDQMESGSEHNWRLAILEADIMLNELLDIQGYKGETMADKMKQVDRARFNTIDAAWEAHKFRNRVAHEGSDLKLEERDVNRIMSLYSRVFREFKVIE